MNRAVRIAVLIILLICLTNSVKKSSGNNRNAYKARGTIALSVDDIVCYAKDAAVKKVKTRMPQIDILLEILLSNINDSALQYGRRELVINGDVFAQAFKKVEKLFEEGVPEHDDSFLRSRIEAPEINYSNFEAIKLFGQNGRMRIMVELKQGYEQELPFTFGAKIRLVGKFYGTIRRVDERGITEIIFDDPESVFFMAPRIAFFIPDVYTKIARIGIAENQITGFVIGNPKSVRTRFVSVSYNLTTCAKKSIKSSELSPDEFEKILGTR